MPKRASNLLVVLLAAVVATASPFGQEASPMPAVHEQPAGCHQHGTAPSPQPVSYRCCQSGHDSAILQISFTSQLDTADLTSPIELIEVMTPDITHPSIRHLANSSADPPGITPLRV
jgi:hypothetical protein